MSVDVRRHAAGSTDGAEAKDPRPEPATPAAPTGPDGWTVVCPLEKLQPERGVAALVAGEPVAVFRTHDDRLFALHNVDPFSGASVLSRGIVGDLAGTPVVASPLHKQHFALETGVAVEDESVVVATYPVRVVDGTVEVGSP
jgi:nitrite reductase (NADH) small subunit